MSFESIDQEILVVGNVLQFADGSLSPETLYVLCPYGIGDTLYALGFMNAYRNYMASGREICFIVKERHVQMIQWFEAIGERFIASDQLTSILDYFTVTHGIWRLDNYLYAHFKKDKGFQLLPAYQKIEEKNMLARYRELVFGLPKDTAWSMPLIPTASEDLIRQYDIDEKTVILMPYAVSAIAISMFFWEMIADSLKKLGYKVFTNVGKDEGVIRGTQELSEDIEKTAGLCEQALAVVALRSGMCDVLAQTEATLFVINTSVYHQEEWNLHSVTKREGIVNLLCDSQDKYLETAKTIISVFAEAMQ